MEMSIPCNFQSQSRRFEVFLPSLDGSILLNIINGKMCLYLGVDPMIMMIVQNC